jgi:type III secretory pathway component EscR
MKKDSLRISAGGEQRLREAVEAQARQAYRDELSKATDPSQKAMIEELIQQKIQKEMERVASPHSLWGSL